MYTEYNDEYSFSRPYLTAGETILWKGKPGKGHLVTSQDVFMIPFSIVVCVFTIFWLVTALSSGVPFFWMFGIPFVCVGLYLVAGRFIRSAYIRKRTWYVITNKKIIRQQGNHIDMLDAKTMPPMRMTAHLDGSGNIQIGEPAHYRRNGRVYRDFSYVFTLENIPEVARVHQIIFNMER